jgi:hypothetical protein
LGECHILILTLTLQVAFPDTWQWRPDPAVGYSVRNAYQLLTSPDYTTLREAKDLLWHRQVPLKVSILCGVSCVIDC